MAHHTSKASKQDFNWEAETGVLQSSNMDILLHMHTTRLLQHTDLLPHSYDLYWMQPDWLFVAYACTGVGHKEVALAAVNCQATSTCAAGL